MRRLAVPLLAAIAVVLGLTAPASATPGSQGNGGHGSHRPLDYVALGDSYSAASGVLPPDPTAAPQCLRSTRNYPHLLAAQLGARSFTDVTCGGADTTHFAAAQYPGVPPQLDALSAETDLVTMTIGGNDSGVFINSILRCGAAGLLTAGQGNPCQQQYGTSFEDTVRTVTGPSLVAALNAVKDRAPNARIAILGYPSILPESGGCFPIMPVAVGDVPYLNSLQATLNQVIADAARETGVTFVDLTGPSRGHDACQPLGVRWIEPVLAGTNPVIVHPNALGEQAMAAAVTRTLRLR